MKHFATILCALCVLCGSSRAADELVVYPPVPGHAASEFFKTNEYVDGLSFSPSALSKP